jgi:hypothetical protein
MDEVIGELPVKEPTQPGFKEIWIGELAHAHWINFPDGAIYNRYLFIPRRRRVTTEFVHSHGWGSPSLQIQTLGMVPKRW